MSYINNAIQSAGVLQIIISAILLVAYIAAPTSLLLLRKRPLSSLSRPIETLMIFLIAGHTFVMKSGRLPQMIYNLTMVGFTLAFGWFILAQVLLFNALVILPIYRSIINSSWECKLVEDVVLKIGCK